MGSCWSRNPPAPHNHPHTGRHGTGCWGPGPRCPHAGARGPRGQWGPEGLARSPATRAQDCGGWGGCSGHATPFARGPHPSSAKWELSAWLSPSPWLCRGDSMVGWESLSASTHPLDPELYVAVNMVVDLFDSSLLID